MFGNDSRTLISLLDLLACAFGGAVLLAVVFMVSNPRAREEAYAARGFVFRMEVEGDASLLTLLLTPPGQSQAVEVNPTELPRGVLTDCGPTQGDSCVLYGWSLDGTARLQAPEGPGDAREYAVVLPEPLEGEWRIGVRYATPLGDPRTWETPIPPARIRSASLAGLDREADDPCVALSSHELALGERAWCAPFEVERIE